jgi:Trk K+ transport system NAD-binding subunit
MCTLIGTSTNVVVHGLMIREGMRGYSLFELGMVGLPCALAGAAYMALVLPRVLPDRKDVQATVEEHKKEYVVEMKVRPGCELAGKTVQAAGLRNLKSLFLLDIERDGKSLGPISSKEIIQAEDRLIFVGVTAAIIDLQDIPGLVPAAHDMFERDFSRMRADFVEAVVSSNSPVLGKTVKEANFRVKYGAGVVAVHRNGERVNSKIGSIKLRAGDTLLLLAPQEFSESWRDSQDFYLISSIKTKAPDAQSKGWLTLCIMGLM